MKYEYWLASLYKINCRKRVQAIETTGAAEKLYMMSRKELSDMGLFTEEEIKYIIHSKAKFDLSGEWEALKKRPITFITYTDTQYPEKLRHIFDPPFALYIRGNLPVESKISVSIVGARMCSEYGRSIAKRLGEQLGTLDVPVISGMAMGIDSAAHAGALSARGKTFAILGCGCDICYPRSSENIYRNILESGGGILSELPPGTKPLPHFFPQRNRIISALADIVVVVEAKERSGSLITADFALEQGKDVYAVPGRYNDTLSAGCNRLIDQGAGILYSVDSFLKNTGIVPENREKNKKTEKFPLEKDELLVYSCLDLHPKFIDFIIEETGLNLLSVLHALENLKNMRLVQETFQNYFCRIL